MKKITLFAAMAAMVATSALAAGPRRAQVSGHATKVNKVSATALSRQLDRSDVTARKFTTKQSLQVTDALPGESEGPVTIAGDAWYRPSSAAFYMGMTPGGSAWYPFGLAGIRGTLGFYNIPFGQDASAWKYFNLVEDEEGKPKADPVEAKTNNLGVTLLPFKEFSTPVLGNIFGADTTFYQSDNNEFFCGGNLVDWGIYATDADTIPDYDKIEIEKVFGVSDCTAPLDTNASWFPELALYRSGGSVELAKTFESTGVSKGWTEYFTQAIKDAKFHSIELTGFTTIISAKTSAYQLGHMWMWWLSNAKEDVALTATVYPIIMSGENAGQIDYEHPMAKGSATLPKGEFPTQANYTMPVFQFEALEDGLTTDELPCVPANQAVAVELTGIDNPNINYFFPMANGSTTMEKSWIVNNDNLSSDDFYPVHAYANLKLVVSDPTDTTEKTDTIENIFPEPFYYFANAEMTTYVYPSDLAMYFNVEFPVVLNPADESANFSVEIPVTGGEGSVDVVSTYNIPGLIEDDIVTYEVTEDWIEFTPETGTDQSFPYLKANIKVNSALPEGMEGRRGYVIFHGYALDFAITVTQGHVAGINQVAAEVANGPVSFYDLQGRKLSAAPAKGLYISRQGNVATKRLAR